MTKSSPEAPARAAAPAPAVAKFSLWPLPDLGHGPQAESAPRTSEEEGASREQDGYARGYAVGQAEATAEANRTLKRAAGLLVSTAEALDAARLGVVRELEDSVYLLALAVARHLIQREVTADPTIVRDLVTRGLEAFPVGSSVEIHMNPEDLNALRSQFGLPGTAGRAADLQWIADAAIERGGCTLETPHRVVDGRVDLALSDLYQRLRDD
jgi:flagellar biosynthesis/type III secretory pathway protein FliH